MKVSEKNNFIVGCFVLFYILPTQVYGAIPPFTLVSDVDDTLRISQVKSQFQAANRLFLKKVEFFSGMRELYQELSISSKKVIYLSGAPQSALQYLQRVMIAESGFPNGIFIFSDWRNWESSENFKRRELESVGKKSDSPFLFIGDDTERDPEVYGQFRVQNPTKTLQIYIHKIENRPLPEEVVGFYTAFEIALAELEERRMLADQVIKVGNAVSLVDSVEELFPVFKHCPQNYTSALGTQAKKNADLVILRERIDQLIRKFCNGRNHRLSR